MPDPLLVDGGPLPRSLLWSELKYMVEALPRPTGPGAALVRGPSRCLIRRWQTEVHYPDSFPGQSLSTWLRPFQDPLVRGQPWCLLGAGDTSVRHD